MERYSKVFGDCVKKITIDQQKRKADALVEIIEAAVQDINSLPSDFVPAKHMRIPDRGLEALVKRFCLSEGRSLKVNIKALRASSPLFGQFEEKIFPLLEGLQERGGMLNGQRVHLLIDKTDFSADIEAAKSPVSQAGTTPKR